MPISGRDSFALRRADSENPGAAWFIFSPSLPTGRYGAPRDAEDLLRKPEAIYFPEPGLYAVGLRALQSANPLGESAVRFHWLEEYRPAQILGAGLFLYRFEPAAGEPPGYDRKTGVCRIDIEALWQSNSPRLREILDANPDDETARRILAQGQMMWAREQIRRGLLESALQDALEARRSHPQPLEPALALAEIYYRLDRPEELADQIEDIERLDPLHRDIERHKAWLRDAHPEIAFRSGNPHPADAEVVSIEELESAEASGPEVLKIESLEGKVQPPAPE